MYGSGVVAAAAVLAIVLVLPVLTLALLLLLFELKRLHIKQEGCAGAPLTLERGTLHQTTSSATIVFCGCLLFLKYLENLYWDVAELELSFAAATVRSPRVKFA